jgi:hypothetical protein
MRWIAAALGAICFTVFFAVAPAPGAEPQPGADTEPGSATVETVVRAAIHHLAATCPPRQKGGTAVCQVVLPRLTFALEPQDSAVVLYFRQPRWMAKEAHDPDHDAPLYRLGQNVQWSLCHVQKEVSGALVHAGLAGLGLRGDEGVVVYIFEVAKPPPPRFFGPTTQDGYAILLWDGPEPCNDGDPYAD